MGAWISYGLGSTNQNLPDYLVLISKMQRPSDQPLYDHYWGSGFLPSRYQGVKLRNSKDPVLYLTDPAGLPLFLLIIALTGLVTTPLQRNITYFHEQQADMFGLNVAREPDGFAEAAVLLSEYRKMEPSAVEEWFFYDHPSGWNRVHNSMVWKAHEIQAGRLAPSPGGPPEGWVHDFVRDREAAAATPAAEPSPAAPSN